MSQMKKIYDKAKASSSNLTFDEVCYLAEKVGFIEKRRGGTSHVIYKHPKLDHPVHGMRMNFQSKKGEAKSYQVDQLLQFIDHFELI